MFRGAFGLAALALWLAACTSGTPESVETTAPADLGWNGITPQPPATPPPPLRVGTPEISFEPPGARRLSEVTDVTVRLRLSGLPGGRGRVDADFLAPGPSAHERHTQQLVAEPTEERELSFRLPVAGTNISAHGLSGPWEVRFFLDGAPLASTTFTLER